VTASVLGISEGRALGCSLRIVVTRPDGLRAAWAAVDEVVTSIDLAASRFREDSELTILNRAPDRVVKVSPLLARAIGVAIRGAELTGGAVDPTVGHALRIAGYDADFDSVPAGGAALRLVARRIPGWRAIQFSAATRTIVLPRGVELDLGATAKALAADLAAESATRALGGGGVLVGLGGDVAVAGEPPAGGWPVQVGEDGGAPLDGDEETVSIASGGIATSGTTVRRWQRGGVALHHIIDPATGLPASARWRTATVAAGSCVDANIASTAAIVMGDRATAWLRANRMTARLVRTDGSIHRLAGWPGRAESKLLPNIF